MNYTKLAIFLISSLWLSQGHAELWQVGVGAKYIFSTPSADSEPYIGALPLVYYTGERWFIDGDRAGYKLITYNYQDSPFVMEASSILGYSLESVDPGVAGLDERKRRTVYAGFSAQSTTPVGLILATVKADVLGPEKAQHATVGWRLPLYGGIIAEASTDWHSQAWGQDLYGVTTQDAGSSQLEFYEPSSSLVHNLGLTLKANLLADWAVMLGYKHSWYGNELFDSPIVEDAAFDSVRLGVIFSF